MQQPINPVEITAEEIARLKAEADGIGGWESDPVAHENTVLKKELAQKEAELIAAKAGMTSAEVNVKALHLVDTINKRLNGADNWTAEELVAMELVNLEAREEAKRIFKTQNSSANLSMFEQSNDLEYDLHADYSAPEWRVKGLLRVGQITTVAGMAKSGKTSLLVNRMKSFVDGNPLFGQFHMGQALEGNVGVWNFELTPGQMTEWFRKADIINRDRIKTLHARGHNLFIQNDIVLEKAIEWVNNNDIEILEIDPLQAAFVGNISSDEDATAFIHALEAIQARTCVKDIILTTHMGHAAAKDADAMRSIGSSRWTGFADNMWIYSRPNDVGIISIPKGRDVFIEPFNVRMDPESKILSYEKPPKFIDENWNAVIAALKAETVVAKTELVESRGEGGNKTKMIGHIKQLKEWGVLDEWKMKKNADGEFTHDGTVGHANTFITLNEVGKRLLHETTPDAEIPDKLWFEGEVGKGVQRVQTGV